MQRMTCLWGTDPLERTWANLGVYLPLKGRPQLAQQLSHSLRGQALALKPIGPFLIHGSWEKWGLSPYI